MLAAVLCDESAWANAPFRAAVQAKVSAGCAAQLAFGLAQFFFKARLTFTKMEDNMVKGGSFRQGGKKDLISQKNILPGTWHKVCVHPFADCESRIANCGSDDRASGNDPMVLVLFRHQFGSFGCDGAQIPIGSN